MRTLQEGADSILNIYLRKNTKQTSQHTWAVVVAQAIEIQHFCLGRLGSNPRKDFGLFGSELQSILSRWALGFF